MRRDPAWLLALLLALVGSAPVRAELDAGTTRPYRVQVVLHVAPNRFLTPLFQDQVRRTLRDQLRLTFGPLARIEVASGHALLRDVEARGLEAGLDRLEATSERTADTRLHFVLLDYAAGEYRLQARPFDGTTGQAGPIVRRAATSDRARVARLAAELIEQDFGLVGTVTAADAKTVKLTFQGGALGVPLDRWVRPGDVFAISRVKEGQPPRAARVPWALVEVLEAPRDGVCRGRYWHRYREDHLAEAPGVLGYRGLQLPARSGPLRLRLLDEQTLRPLDGVQLHVKRTGEAKREEMTTGRDGVAVSRADYSKLALVRVVAGGAIRAQLPVAIVDDRTIVCRVKLAPEAEGLAALEFRRDAWLRRVFEDVRLAVERTAELNRLLGRSLTAALQAGQTGLKDLDAELAHLDTERDELQRQARERKLASGALDLREGEQQLEQLRQRRADLASFVERVGSVVKESSSPEELTLTRLLERARLHEAEADYGPALRLYRQVLKVSPGQGKVRERLERLEKAWQPRDAKHAEARKFVYETWPGLDAAGLKANLDRARAAFATVRAADDRLTARKLQRIDALHAANLKKQLDALKGRDSEDNRNRARELARLAEGLRGLHAEVAAFLDIRKK